MEYNCHSQRELFRESSLQDVEQISPHPPTLLGKPTLTSPSSQRFTYDGDLLNPSLFDAAASYSGEINLSNIDLQLMSSPSQILLDSQFVDPDEPINLFSGSANMGCIQPDMPATADRCTNQSFNALFPNIEDVDLKQWTGDGLDFQITPVPPKGSKFCFFSESLGNKLICRKGDGVPFQIRMNFNTIDTKNLANYKLKAFLLYEDLQFINDPVRICDQHKLEEMRLIDKENENQTERLHHRLRLMNEKANVAYVRNPVSERCYVVAPLQPPEAGNDYVTKIFTFTCLNTCAPSGSGSNRKSPPTSIMFHLYNDKNVKVAKSFCHVRVCSAPQRDLRKEEEKKDLKEKGSGRKRKSAEATVVCTQGQMNAADVPGSLSTVRRTLVAPAEEAEISSSQETVYSDQEGHKRIRLRSLINRIRKNLKHKNSPNPVFRKLAENLYNNLVVMEGTCDTIDMVEASLQDNNGSPDNGFHEQDPPPAST